MIDYQRKDIATVYALFKNYQKPEIVLQNSKTWKTEYDYLNKVSFKVPEDWSCSSDSNNQITCANSSIYENKASISIQLASRESYEEWLTFKLRGWGYDDYRLSGFEDGYTSTYLQYISVNKIRKVDVAYLIENKKIVLYNDKYQVEVWGRYNTSNLETINIIETIIKTLDFL